eukprot:scaffold3806_cov94-Isochrysis_galbana.AAC.8
MPRRRPPATHLLAPRPIVRTALQQRSSAPLAPRDGRAVRHRGQQLLRRSLQLSPTRQSRASPSIRELGAPAGGGVGPPAAPRPWDGTQALETRGCRTGSAHRARQAGRAAAACGAAEAGVEGRLLVVFTMDGGKAVVDHGLRRTGAMGGDLAECASAREECGGEGGTMRAGDWVKRGSGRVGTVGGRARESRAHLDHLETAADALELVRLEPSPPGLPQLEHPTKAGAARRPVPPAAPPPGGCSRVGQCPKRQHEVAQRPQERQNRHTGGGGGRVRRAAGGKAAKAEDDTPERAPVHGRILSRGTIIGGSGLGPAA